MRDLVFFDEPDHFQGIGAVHDDVGRSHIKVGHQKTVQLRTVEQRQGMQTDIVRFVLTVKNAAVIL